MTSRTKDYEENVKMRLLTPGTDSCGSLVHGRELILPFAVSDRASAVATVSLDDLLAALREG